jgi:hypothetical protein
MPQENEQARTARPGEFADLIQRICDQHAINGQKVEEGASEAEIARAEELIGFELPPLLKALYRDSNGGLAYGFWPLFDLNRARRRGVIDCYLACREADLGEENPFAGRRKRWPAYLLPISDQPQDGDLAVLCNDPRLPVKLVGWGESKPIEVAPSLAAWLETWLVLEARRGR